MEEPLVWAITDSGRRSFAITDHDQKECASCKGAAVQQMNHYAIGRLRLTIALDLGMTRAVAQDMPLLELLAAWHQSKHEAWSG